MRRIILPFDLEMDMGPALGIAAEVALRTNSEIVLVNAFGVDRKPGERAETYDARVRTRWYKAFQKAISFEARLPKPLEGNEVIPCRYEFRQSRMIDLLRDLLQHSEATLIVLQVESGFRNAFQVGDAVVHHLLSEFNTPVLLLQGGFQEKRLERAWFPIPDGQSGADFYPHILGVVDFLEKIGIKVEMHAESEGDLVAWAHNVGIMKRKRVSVALHYLVETYPKGKLVLELGQKLAVSPPDMVAMVWEGQVTSRSFLGGSYSNGQGIFSHLPVLLLPGPRKEA